MTTFNQLQDLFVTYFEAKVAAYQAGAELEKKDTYPLEPARSQIHAWIIKGRLEQYNRRRALLNERHRDANQAMYKAGKDLNRALQDFGIPAILEYQGNRFKIQYNYNSDTPNLILEVKNV